MGYPTAVWGTLCTLSFSREITLSPVNFFDEVVAIHSFGSRGRTESIAASTLPCTHSPSATHFAATLGSLGVPAIQPASVQGGSLLCSYYFTPGNGHSR